LFSLWVFPDTEGEQDSGTRGTYQRVCLSFTGFGVSFLSLFLFLFLYTGNDANAWHNRQKTTTELFSVFCNNYIKNSNKLSLYRNICSLLLEAWCAISCIFPLPSLLYSWLGSPARLCTYSKHYEKQRHCSYLSAFMLNYSKHIHVLFIPPLHILFIPSHHPWKFIPVGDLDHPIASTKRSTQAKARYKCPITRHVRSLS
jgi:hypothetical protein